MCSVFRSFAPALLLLYATAAWGAATIKIGLIDALSGPRAAIGQASLNHLRAAAANANAYGGALGLKFEVVAFDDKSVSADALVNLNAAIQQGIRYVAHGGGGDTAKTIAEAIDKHNASNPARAALFLDVGSGAFEVAGEACSFWHFRFDASSAMRLGVLIEGIVNDPAVRRLFLLNPDTAAGHGVSRETQRILSERRPDIAILGDELYPAGKVKDFAPYLPDLIDAGVDTVLTAGRGSELGQLIRAAKDLKFRAVFHTLYAWLPGAPSQFGAAGADRVTSVFTWHANIEKNPLEAFSNDFKTKYQDEWRGLPEYIAVNMIATAMETSRSTEPINIARVLKGLSYLGPNGPVWVRKEDHQLFQPLFVATFTKAGVDSVKYDAESTGYGWKTRARFDADKTLIPTNCNKQPPG